MGFRTAFRKLAKPVVMTLVAGSLALSLTVSTTQQAEAAAGVAVAPVIAAAEGVLAGGVRLALPSLLSIAIATTPVGWIVAGGLAIGALGVGLYSTRDYWVPFVAGTFGGAVPDAPAATGAVLFPTLKVDDSYIGVSPAPPSGIVVWSRMTGTTSGLASTALAMDCKRVDGSIYRKTGGGLGSLSSTSKAYGVALNCDVSTDRPQGWIAGPYGGHADLPSRQATGDASRSGPENVKRGGTLLKQAFDAKGGDVKYKTTSECIDDGGNTSSISAEWFGNEGGMKVPSCAAAGKGHGTGKMSVEGYAPTAPGVPGTVPQPVWDAQAPTADPDHPLCGPQRPGPGCEMKIAIDGNPCAVGVWECENWTDLWKDSTTSARVSCTYGPYAMAVSACTIMEPAYRPGGAPATEPNMDGEPATRSFTQPGGTTYAPPSTGTGTVPGLGGQPGPGSSPEEQGCFPTGWAALNPIEWVMKPVGCALTAAFVPKPEVVQAQQTRLQTKFQNVGFARITDAWLATFESVGGGGGCAGPTVNFSMQGVSQSLQPFNACSAPMSTVAGITYAVSAIGIVLFGGLGMIRAVGSAFGFNFTLGKGASE